jgi:hypothetical protein
MWARQKIKMTPLFFVRYGIDNAWSAAGSGQKIDGLKVS